MGKILSYLYSDHVIVMGKLFTKGLASELPWLYTKVILTARTSFQVASPVHDQINFRFHLLFYLSG
jgi:hypothetical protein